MTATVNGERRELPEGITVADLLSQLGIAPSENTAAGIAVAVNERVVPARRLASHAIADGDVVEVIRAVAGG